MALDGLRREFPEVVALARRVPPPRISKAAVLWAVLAGYGAAFFVGAAITTISWVLLRPAPDSPGVPAFPISSVAATAALFGVAWRAGGRDALVPCAIIELAQRVLALPGLFLFCARTQEVCTFGGYLASLWPYALGIPLAYLLARWLRLSEGEGNRLLEAGGALTLTARAIPALASPFMTTASELTGFLLVLVAAVAAGVACGAVVVLRNPTPRQWPTLGTVAIGVLGPWLVLSVPLFLAQAGVGGSVRIGGLSLLSLGAPVIELVSAALVLYMTAARRVLADT